jgi:hypothetical protein
MHGSPRGIGRIAPGRVVVYVCSGRYQVHRDVKKGHVPAQAAAFVGRRLPWMRCTSRDVMA